MKNIIELNIPGLTDKIALTCECWKCNNDEDVVPLYNILGKHNGLFSSKKSECQQCYGKGFLLTKQGEAILKLVHYFGDVEVASDWD